jgi:hypothetical protein
VKANQAPANPITTVTHLSSFDWGVVGPEFAHANLTFRARTTFN